MAYEFVVAAAVGFGIGWFFGRRAPAAMPPPEAVPEGRMRVLGHRKVADQVYEVVTESAKYGQVTRRVLVLSDAAMDSLD